MALFFVAITLHVAASANSVMQSVIKYEAQHIPPCNNQIIKEMQGY